MSIHGISGPGPVRLPAGISEAGRPAQGAGKTSFGDLLKGALEGVEGVQQDTAGSIKDYLAGRTPDVLPVVTAMAKADLSFKMLIGVRNKVLEAYKQTMNMNI